MMAAMSKPVRRAIALALLVMPSLAVYGLLAMPLLDGYRAQQEAIREMRHRAVRFAQIARETGMLERRLAARRRSERERDGYLDGSNETLVGAALQSRVKALIEESGGTTSSSQILAPREEENVRRITVQFAATQTTASLARALEAIAADPSVLLVEQLDIRARPVVSGGTDIAEPARLLEVRLEVSGFMRPGAP